MYFISRKEVLHNYKNYDTLYPSQLARDVVTTLSFGCILVATSDNVFTTLSQRCVPDFVTTTKN